jgi:hypothetical protein
MKALLIFIILFLLLGGGGYVAGGPVFGGIGIGLVLCGLGFYLLRGFRRGKG